MKKKLIFVILAVCFFLSCDPAHARLILDSENRLVLMRKDEKIIADETVTIGNVHNSDMQFAALGNDSMHGVSPGIYLFKNRKLFKKIHVPDPDLCCALSLSPNGSILAVDSGTSVVREWTFYNMASHKKIGKSITYVSGSIDLAWKDNERVLVTYPDGEPRECQTDQCSPLSVGIFNISTGTMHTVFKGSDRCDFTLFDASPATVTAEKLCLENRGAWAEYTGGKAPEIVSRHY